MKTLALIAALSFVVSADDFQILSVKANKSPVVARSGRDGLARRYTGVNMTVPLLIQQGYELREDQVSGLPAWAATERYDIDVVGEPGPNGKMPAVVYRKILREILTKYFKLRFHYDSKPMEVFALQLDPQGLKMAETAGPGAAGEPELGQIEGRGKPISALVENLKHLLNAPVVDETGLKGRYDFKLTWLPGTTESEQNHANLAKAVQEQLGLKLEARTGPVHVLMVDRVVRLR